MALGVQVALGRGQLLGHAKSGAAGKDGDLRDGIGMLESAATSACPASWTATACFSSGSSAFDASRRPMSSRSLAASKSAAVSTRAISRAPR